MNKYVKVCEILTDTAEDTVMVLEFLKNTEFSVCQNGGWGDTGADLYVMKPMQEADG